MKSLFSCVVGSALVFSLASCGGRAASEESNIGDGDSSEMQAPAIYLEGMYATSSRLPLNKYSPENIFDGNPETYWSTAVGAGSDEGVMLYFSGETYVKELKLTGAAGNDLASIKSVSIYGDGHKLQTSDLSSAIKIDKTLTSLFIKIEETDHSNVIDLSGREDGEKSLETFDDKFSVGLSEIEVFDASAKLELRAPVSMAGSVVASSVLSPADAYNATQLFDSRKEFVWAEGGKGAGENENLTFNLDKEQTISLIKIWNGYQRSEKHFAANARIKSFEFGIKNGSKAVYTLQDGMDAQEVTLGEPLTGREFVLTVLEVYPGKDYKDLVVSEMLFYNGDVPFVISDNGAEQKMELILAKTNGSVLEKYIDRRLKNHFNLQEFTSDRSLILRSNRTFVYYDHTTTSDGSKEENKEIVADGNWEIIEQTGEYAKVRIFGKLLDLSETVEYYKGNTTTEIIKIFQDNLHITPGEVKGEKHIDAFYNKPTEL